MATSTLPSGEPSRKRNSYVTLAFSGVPNKGDKIKSGYVTPCLLRGPQEVGNCYVTPAFLGVPNKGGKIRSGYLTPAFSGALNRAELLCISCILGDL